MAKNCNECKKETANQEMTIVSMSSADWQRNEQRHEKREKRLWIALIITICLLFSSFALFVWYESQFETIDYSYDYSQDGQGTNIIGNNNEVDNGSTVESQSESKTQTQE